MSAAIQWEAPPIVVTLSTLETISCWVGWQTEGREDGKPTKVPYGSDGRRAKANAPATWTTRVRAEAVAARLPKPYGAGGVGIELHALVDGRSLAGVDLDTCRDPDTGQLQDWAHDVIVRFASYTEVSPSGAGVKIFFTYSTTDFPTLRAAMNGSEYSKLFKRGGGEHPPAIELHLGNRYFAVTNEALPDSCAEFQHVDTATLLHLITVEGPAFARGDSEDAGETGDAKPSNKPRPKGRAFPGDRSRSSAAFRKGKELRRSGATFEEMVAALDADPETAEWSAEKGHANRQRELHRIWDKAEAKGPVIRLLAGELHTAATNAEDALITSGLPIYQRGAGLVRPVTREVPASRGRMTLAAGLGEMNVHSMVDVMCSVAEWERFDARADDWVRVNPPGQVAQILLSRHGQWRLPSIAGVITTPTLRPDGSLLTDQGYDSATRLYHVADPSLRLHPGVHQPTRDLATRALKLLTDLLGEFPFVTTERPNKAPDRVALAVALSGLITPVVRGAMSVAPLHALNAHAPGSGKSYYVDVASMIATGRPCPVISAAPDEAETEKRTAGLLLAGYPVVSLDNVNGELGGDLLCQAIERPLIRIRPLGASDIIELESCVTMFATGNNIRVRGDMVRRSLVAELDAQEERPELRAFNGDPVAAIAADRGRYVSAALVIVRAYIAAGKPNPLPSIASFEGWSNTVRSALVWLGCADPADSMEQARQDDPELGELSEMLEAWKTSLKVGIGFTTRQVASEVARDFRTDQGEHDGYQFPELRDAVMRIAGERGEVNTKRLGKWLSSREGRIVAGKRFSKIGAATSGGVVRWGITELGLR